MGRTIRAAFKCLRSDYVEKRLDINTMITSVTLQDIIADPE